MWKIVRKKISQDSRRKRGDGEIQAKMLKIEKRVNMKNKKIGVGKKLQKSRKKQA